jgi:hypothetical protein
MRLTQFLLAAATALSPVAANATVLVFDGNAVPITNGFTEQGFQFYSPPPNQGGSGVTLANIGGGTYAAMQGSSGVIIMSRIDGGLFSLLDLYAGNQWYSYAMNNNAYGYRAGSTVADEVFSTVPTWLDIPMTGFNSVDTVTFSSGYDILIDYIDYTLPAVVVASVPEPGTMMVFGVGLLGLGALVRHRRLA